MLADRSPNIPILQRGAARLCSCLSALANHYVRPSARSDARVLCRIAAERVAQTTDTTAASLHDIATKDGVFVTSKEEYLAMYELSINDPQGFWATVAKQFHWHQQWQDEHLDHNMDVRDGRVAVEWFNGGLTNICYNALDRHVLAGRGDNVAFLWEGNDPAHERRMTYREALEEVSRLANWLRSVGVKKGDTVSIYLPMVLELPLAMLACARIGAIHSVVFGGFSAEALADRILDCKAEVLLTTTSVMRGAKPIDLKKVADKALAFNKARGHTTSTVLVLDNALAVSAANVPFSAGRDRWWHDEVPSQATTSDPEWVESEHPLFLLYTSGSTGKPKGVVHSTAGYMVYAATTVKHVFNLQPGDVYFCTADCGWITGHSYLTYGPLLNGATNVVFEGVPTYPTPERYWQIVDKYQVTQFYTAPTAIRSLMASGDSHLQSTTRASLRILGSVGEPINPEAWHWYHSVVGGGRCPIVDTWWQTETGGHMISPLPGAWAEKPGAATLPFFGVQPVVLDAEGRELEGEAEGLLCIKAPWPSMIRGIFNDQERYEESYFKLYPGYYFTGDGCRRDADGYYWITGRVDDVINVSGHRIGTAEVESALTTHAECAEAAVVAFDHAIKGQGIYAYVTLKDGVQPSGELKKALVGCVRNNIGAFAAPDVVHWAPALPKTRSGKIMRRVLRKIAAKEEAQIGDTSTLADPSVVEALVQSRGK